MNSLILIFFFSFQLIVYIKSQDDYNNEEFYDDQDDNIGNSSPKPDIRINKFLMNITLNKEMVDQILIKQILNYEEKRST